MDEEFLNLLLAGLVSGGFLSTIFGYALHRNRTRTEQAIKKRFDEGMTVFSSQRAWKEQCVSELLGPMIMQMSRTKRAFKRWQAKNLFLESKIIGEGNRTVRDLLLQKGHLIPTELLIDADLLIEHYDVWLEEFEALRKSENPDTEATFVFAGPRGKPFPSASEQKFLETFQQYHKDLYGE